jgi:HD superfamily phosphohydrolase
LLHDIGHGPFSHALENVLIENMHHEAISLLLMQDLNQQFEGKLSMALDIFTNVYPKKYLHQLITGQLDVDRMDYLTRDSFFTGVSEGVIGYDRILKMLTVHEGELMVEEKGIYSIEKFLVSRRLMYWQVYLHKTVLCAEQMLKGIITRAKYIRATTRTPLNGFIQNEKSEISLQEFCALDDYDVLSSIKEWAAHEDKVLSILCEGIINRRLFKVEFSKEPLDEQRLREKREEVMKTFQLNEKDAEWLVFTGIAKSSTYNFEDEHIHILFKNGQVKDISEVDNALIHQNMKSKIKKYYICFVR